MGEPIKEVGGLASSKRSSPPVGAILRHMKHFTGQASPEYQSAFIPCIIDVLTIVARARRSRTPTIRIASRASLPSKIRQFDWLARATVLSTSDNGVRDRLR